MWGHPMAVGSHMTHLEVPANSGQGLSRDLEIKLK
jgi:hypothetical protein